MIPTMEECLGLMERTGMPEHIRMHSMQVNRVAMFLAGRMRERGIKVDMNLVDAASMLHDIDKHLLLRKGTQKGHGEVGADMLAVLGYGELVPLVRRHVLCNILEDAPETWEEKIVHYSDMRVTREEVVSLESRLEYIKERYGTTPEKVMNIEECGEKIREMEREIREAAGLSDGELRKAFPAAAE